jgi:subtilisin family serine protease
MSPGENVQKYSLAGAVALLPLAALVSSPTAFALPAKGAEQARVIVAYKDGQRGNAERALAMAGAERHYDLAPQRSFAVTLPAVAVAGLSRNPAIDYVEDDVPRHPLSLASQEVVPYGITMTQANLVPDTTTTTGTVTTSADNSMVCIIDSGLDIGHRDHSPSGTKIKGYTDPGKGSWTTASPSTWYTDENHHGTHVAGTIAALSGNGQGVVGVAPHGVLNLYIVKVFGASGWAYSSSLVDALNRCVLARDNTTVDGFAGRKLVVSMSLGGSLKSRTEETAFNNAYSKSNVLPIAAAGNGGNTRVSYPAGYSGVVSVAAVDEAKAKASFSQANSDVEIAAPGVGVLSTVPRGAGAEAIATVNNVGYAAEAMDGSPQKSGTGALVDCGLGGTTCAGAGGKVCLIQRGTYDFSTKVLSCQNGGGVGAIIYNNTAGALLGTLNGVVTTIPSVGITQDDGQWLKANALGKASTVGLAASDYAKFDGTSMATPHVSAIAALIWSYAPKCTNAQVRTALTSTAEDLGTTGRDTSFGFGLVRAKNALTALQALSCSK